MTEFSTNGYYVGSNLDKVIRSGQFVVTGELGPPQGWEREEIEHKAQLLKGLVDGVNLTDNQTAIVRMSSIAAARVLVEEGLEPIMQMTCRDRNRLGMQGDLLGAYALGVRNVLALSGDHQVFGNHPTAKNVHDIDSMQLIKMIRDMGAGRFQNGDDIVGGPMPMLVGAAANPFADPFDFRPYRLAKKVACWSPFHPDTADIRYESFSGIYETCGGHGFARKGCHPGRCGSAKKQWRSPLYAGQGAGHDG